MGGSSMNLKYLISKNLTFSQIIKRKQLKYGVLKLRGKILDLGCGSGEYSYLAANRENQVIGVDTKVPLKSKFRNVSFVEADAHYLPFADNSFDACLCAAVLEHVEDPEKILNEACRVLKPKGKLIVTVPFLQEIHADPYDFRRYTSYGLNLLLTRAGFRVLKTKCDYGALNTVEYLLLGSIVWRFRMGLKYNLPFGYIYILFLLFSFLVIKLSLIIFYALQKSDIHFATTIMTICEKSSPE